MLIDDVTIRIKAGDGGAGSVAFNKTKNNLGPTGGSGGLGGSIYFVGASELDALQQFRFRKVIEAEGGHDGRGQFVDGAGGGDLFLKIPTGTIVHNLTNNTELEIINVGEPVLIAKGGKGGKGNFLFRSSRNTSPEQSQPGLDGEEFQLRLELKMMADIGFVGLPNVGKSSLLKELTNANPKVANYPFTTLEPSLGVYYDLILADIPGLIEGASKGKGLGIKFLKHIERTKILFHFIASDSSTPVTDYKTIRKELGRYNKELLEKPEYVFLSRNDTTDSKDLEKKIKALKKYNDKVITISIYDYDSIEGLKKVLNSIADEKMNRKSAE
ncbi:MAG: GTPase ObgE [Candidatus Pacebacteria bacterium]|nr:GTPase ObgE [Candidatus Paceibacterota bacterium]